jgi:CMP/dCMP kinase
MIITIDGPTASGKSTLAMELAKELNIYHLNSGYLYRALAYVLVNYFNYNEEKLRHPNINDLIEILNPSIFVYSYENQKVKILYNNKDITFFLKTAEIDNYSSIISTIIDVRKILLSYQRNFAQKHDLVIEGRDCGSVVFPNADIKIYLTAPLEVRAMRWQKDMQKKGKNFSLDEAIKIVNERDERDLNRKISPLVVPESAIIIDDACFSQNELLEKVLKIIKKVNV